MDAPTPRPSPSNVVAACIVAAGLVAAATILAHRPPVMAAGVASAQPAEMPPVAQEAVAEQFRAQVLAAPNLHTLVYQGVTYTLTDVKLDHIVYSAKDDAFTVPYDWIWQPAMIADGPRAGVANLTNDGYRHYYDTVGPADNNRQPIDPSKVVDVTVR